jgi:hypothetical protein
MAQYRTHINIFDRMPPEADDILSWAEQELSQRRRSQVDLYKEFVAKCEALMAEHEGKLQFAIPSFYAFHRHAVRIARLNRRLDETRAIVAAIAEKIGSKESDELTLMTAETLKSLILHIISEHDDKTSATAVRMLADAFRAAVQAQAVVVDRQSKAALKAQVTDVVDRVASAKGITAETAEAIKTQILGVVT